MKLASLIFVILFGVASLVHLYFCYKEDEKKRHISKPFCLFLLALAAVFYAPTEPLIYIGALLGMVGDIFLLFKKDKKCFIVGTFVFFAGHICYMYQAFRMLPFAIPFYIQIIIFVSLVIVMFIAYPFTKGIAGIAALPGSGYMALLLANLALGIVVACNTVNPLHGILFALGYLSFFVSDTILTITTFKKDVKRRDLYIMFFYLTAELLIVLSLCLMC